MGVFGVLPPPQTDVGALCICVAGNFGVALTWGGLLGGSRGHAAALFLGGGGLWACPRLRRGKAKAAGERVAASAWQGLVLGCSLGGPHPRPLHLLPPSPGGIGAQGPLNPYLQLGFPVLPQFPHLQNGVSDTEPPLKTFRGSSKALYHWGDSGDMGGGGRRVNAVGEALGAPVRS